MSSTEHYPLNYAWDIKHWNEDRDVMLEAQFSGVSPAQIAPLLEQWLHSKQRDQQVLDQQTATIFYAGGAWFHWPAVDSLQFYIHSAGQDAFDSIHYYANHLADYLFAALGPKLQLQWIEHPHRRDYLRAH